MPCPLSPGLKLLRKTDISLTTLASGGKIFLLFPSEGQSSHNANRLEHACTHAHAHAEQNFLFGAALDRFYGEQEAPSHASQRILAQKDEPYLSSLVSSYCHQRWSCVLTCSCFHSHGAYPEVAHPCLAIPPTSHTSLASVYSFKIFPAFSSLPRKAHLQRVCPIYHLDCVASCCLARFVAPKCPRAGDAQVLSIGAPTPGCSRAFLCWRKGKAWPFGASTVPARRVNAEVRCRI